MKIRFGRNDVVETSDLSASAMESIQESVSAVTGTVSTLEDNVEAISGTVESVSGTVESVSGTVETLSSKGSFTTDQAADIRKFMRLVLLCGSTFIGQEITGKMVDDNVVYANGQVNTAYIDSIFPEE